MKGREDEVLDPYVSGSVRSKDRIPDLVKLL